MPEHGFLSSLGCCKTEENASGLRRTTKQATSAIEAYNVQEGKKTEEGHGPAGTKNFDLGDNT